MKDINKDLENNFNNAEKLRNTNYDGAIKLLLNILRKKEKNSAANCYFQLNKFDLEKYYLKCLKIEPETQYC